MDTRRILTRCCATALLLAAPLAVQATNGYFAHGYGTKNGGMAGAGVALPQDALAAATNPAGMVMVGNRMDLGAALFSPRREYTAQAPTGPGLSPPGPAGLGLAAGDGRTVESDNELFLVPHFGRNWMLDANSAFGVSVYGNGGMNTEWPAAEVPGGGGTFDNPANNPPPAGTAGVDLAQLFIAPTYARKTAGGGAWGVSAIVAYQRFKATGLSDFGGLSNDPANLSNRGYDDSFGFGARVGYIGQLSPAVSFGASYQTKIAMDEFGKYAGLFAEQGDFDIPPSATVGIAWQTSPRSTLLFDIQWTGYGEVASIANPMRPGIENCVLGDTTSCLGGANGFGFGWDDMTTFKLGYQWESSPDWTWRVGFSTGDQPIPSSEVTFNILAPGVIEEHVTFGFTRQMGSDQELNFAFMYALEGKVSGNSTGSQQIELKMDQFQLELSWGWRF